MIQAGYPIRTRGLPVGFFLEEDANVFKVEISKNGEDLLFYFSQGFYLRDRDGMNPKELKNAILTVRLDEGFKVLDNIKFGRRVHMFRAIKWKRFRKNVDKKGFHVTDILYSHHTRTIQFEGKAKGLVALHIDHVRDIKIEFLEPKTRIYDSYIVNRRDVFRFKKREA